MGLFFFKKKEVSIQVKDIENFNFKLNEMLNKNTYIARSEYKSLIDDFADTYKYFMVLVDSKTINNYCKNNSIKSSVIEDFIYSYKEIHSIFLKHNNEFIKNYKIENKEYLDNILKDVDSKIVLDDNQRNAILTDEDYSLIIAGAGAGKTTTIAAKVKYLIDKKSIKPEDILIVSFTNKAVGELREKINRDLKIGCNITTFHTTGNDILRKQSEEKLKIAREGFLYNIVRDYLTVKIKDKKTYDNLLLFFGSYFDVHYEGDNKETLFNYLFKSDFSTLKSNLNEYKQDYINIKSKKQITLNNEIVSSAQEVIIANFLYMNGIEYEYEPIYPYHIYKARKKYTPDFLIRQGDKVIYLEHFGISQDGKNNIYSKETLEEYKKAINDKIKIHKAHNTRLIYTFSKYNDGRSLLDHLKELLFNEGFVLNPKDSKEVVEKLAHIEENKYFSKFIKLICRFIGNFKVNGYTEEDFYRFIRTTKSVRTKLFLEICIECYLEYQKALSKDGAVDFQDMINDAAKTLKEIENLKIKLNYKYVFVDEYQDISNQRFDLVKEISKVCDAKIIVVGDDWQSIYAFSGSNVSLFTKFKEKFGYCAELQIVNTYRNSQEVIDIAGGFIQKNDHQIKKSLISPKHIENPIYVMSYDDTPKKYNESGKKTGPEYKLAETIEKSIEHILKDYKNGEKIQILLIGRYNYDGHKLSNTGLFQYDEYSGNVFSIKYPHVELVFLTAHSSKGLGYDNVIIINAKDAVFGFPSKIENDPVMDLVINLTDEMDYAEERRLFYVALTRTKNRIYIITPEKHPSSFVLELINDYKTIKLDGRLDPHPSLLTNKLCPVCGFPLQLRHKKSVGMDLWVCTNESEVCGFLSNNLSGGKMSIQKCDCCDDGYLIIKTKDGHPLLGCTNYKSDGTGCNRTISFKEYEKSINNSFEEINHTTSNINENPQTLPAENIDDSIINSFNIISGNVDSLDVVCGNIFNAYIEMRKIGNGFGVEKLCKYLHGSKSKFILSFDLVRQDYYGIYSKYCIDYLRDIINWLITKNVFIRDNSEYRILIANKNPSYLSDEDYKEIECTYLKMISGEAFIHNQNNINKKLNDDSDELYEILRNVRRTLGSKFGVDYLFVIASNSVLKDLSIYKPTTKEEYLTIKGCSEKTYECYGKYFIEAINRYLYN